MVFLMVSSKLLKHSVIVAIDYCLALWTSTNQTAENLQNWTAANQTAAFLQNGTSSINSTDISPQSEVTTFVLP